MYICSYSPIYKNTRSVFSIYVINSVYIELIEYKGVDIHIYTVIYYIYIYIEKEMLYMSHYTKGKELDVRRVLAEVPEGHVYKGVPLHEHGIMWSYSEHGERKLAIMADSGVDYEAVLVEDDKDNEAWFNFHLSTLNESDLEEVEKAYNILFNMALEVYPEGCGVSNFNERVKVLHNEGCPVYSIREKFGTYGGPLYIVSNGTEYTIHSGCFTAGNMNEWMYRLKFRRKLYPTWDVLHGEDVELVIQDMRDVIAHIEGSGL